MGLSSYKCIRMYVHQCVINGYVHICTGVFTSVSFCICPCLIGISQFSLGMAIRHHKERNSASVLGASENKQPFQMDQGKEEPSREGRNNTVQEATSPLTGKSSSICSRANYGVCTSAYNLIKPTEDVSAGPGSVAEYLGSPGTLQTTGVL